MRPKVAVAILLGLLLLVIILQNSQVVAVRFLFWEIEMSRLLLILLAAAVGFIGGYVVASLRAGGDGRATPGVTARSLSE